MLAIRLQRTGRSGHTQFRVVVQDSRFSPKRGRIVAYLGNYDPHTKTATFDSQKAAQYLENGAQPSERVALLLKKEGVKLPAWVKLSEPQKRTVRHPEKRRSTRPAEAEAPATKAADETTESAEPADPESSAEATGQEPQAVEETAAAPAAEEPSPAETPAEEAVPTEETPAEESTAEPEAPAEQAAPEETPPEKTE